MPAVRIHPRRSLGGALAVLAIALAACAQPPAAQPQRAAPSSAAPAGPAPNAASSPAASAPATPTKIRLAYEAGVFAKHGLEVELSYVASSQTVPATLSGDVDIAIGGGYAVINSRLA